MVKRPTIPDLAEAAGVSVSTVNRVINKADSVRQPTRERVLRAAQEIGFYGLGAIEYSVHAGREVHRPGVLLLQERRPFYRDLGAAFRQAAEEHTDGRIELTLEFLDDLSPEVVADRLRQLGANCDSVALVAAEHPLIADAIDSLLLRGTPVMGLITPLTARGNVGYVGLDSFKVGRTAAWAFDKICHQRGEIGILVGNTRYRNQDLNESGFRSYFRENASGFTLLEPRATFESADVAREMTEDLFAQHPKMCGIFISGGGITGSLAALREAPRRPGFVAVGYELMDVTRRALFDGTLTMAISHPMEALARQTLAALVKSKRAGPDAGAQNVMLDFDIHTSENL
ncbi:LacI family DNA-binding transcriptional regulator [Mameliella alba]|uniref:Transcriptional regulator n=1 Tax=Mameliella alba TaxID=561184 RepID=A0A0B3RRS6_9RHOB|nr:LacI family DNA-binding transcriptional regulator [Mameliella alba]KHQ50612.1 Transcriptional regulator [Mameliella alba]